MALSEYLRILRRHWMLVVSVALIGLLAGGVISALSKPTYTAETELFVAIQSSGSVADLQQGNTFSQARVQSYVKTATTPIVLQPAIDALGLDVTPAELASRVKVSTNMNTVLINVAVTDSSPVGAAATAQAVADSLVRAVDKLETPKAGGTSPVGLSVVTPATAPTSPSSPNTRLNLLVGLLLGAVIGIGLAFLRATLDHTIQNESDLRRATPFPLLGGIAFDSEASKRPLLGAASDQSPRAESFRQLRTNLQFANVSTHAKSVLLTSSVPGEGKSTTATNLAISLAQAGSSVCLVDADLRRPMVGEYLGLDSTAGLTTALLGSLPAEDLLQAWGEDNLFVLTSGRIPPNPSELLGSQEMKALLTRLEDSFDLVIIDAPPLLPVTDAAVLSQHVGGVVLVVGSKRVKIHDVERAIGALELVDADVLGVVFNLISAKGPDAYSYTYSSIPTKSGSRRPNAGRRLGGPASPEERQFEDPVGLEAFDDARSPVVFPRRRRVE